MKSKPRHCMIVYSIYPLGETRVQREAEALIQHGYDVDVICVRLPGEPSIGEYKKVHIYREKDIFPIPLPSSSGLAGKFLRYLCFFLSAAFRVTQLHLQKHYSTVQVHNLPDFLVFSAFVPKLLGTPVILDLHDLMPEFYIGRSGSSKSFAARIIRLQERFACRFADHVITVSEHWRQALIHRGVPEEKCSVVMNVADEAIFYPSPMKRSRSSNIDCFHLIYHGTFVERYGLDLAIRAIDRLRSVIPGIHLTLIGYGEYLPQIQELINELDLNSYVTVDKLRQAEELPDLIQSCDLGIVPYKNDVFTDGLLPTKLMEYAALGMPAIASRTTAIEAYFRGSNTEFFEPGDLDDLVGSITRLYQDPTRMAELARGSNYFNQRYNWAKIRTDYIRLVERLRTERIATKSELDNRKVS